jgi:beta-lactamase superfamily II metal-dependent hydrolase
MIQQSLSRTRPWQRALRRLLAFLLLCCMALCAAVPAAAQDVTPSARVTRNVVVREQASTASTPVGRLVPGDRATVIAEVPGWYRVRLADGTTGFVSKAWTVPVGEPFVATAAAAAYKVHVIDVGTGLSVFVEGPDFTLLYDGGSQDDLASGSGNRILAYLAKVRPDLRAIDHLVLSHPHKDHLELLPDVFDRYQIRNVWESGRVNETNGYCRFLKKVEAEPGVLYHDAIASNAVRTVSFTGSNCSGSVRVAEAAQMEAAPVRLGAGAQMAMLYRDAKRYADPNGNSVVVRVDLGSRRILLAGDAEGGERQLPATAPAVKSIEAQLLACCRADLKADVLVVGHHGSLTSSRSVFLDAVQASMFAISSGPFPYQTRVLPDSEIVAELKGRGRLLETDLDDDQCAANPAKIGPDADESPGGCKNILISVGANGSLLAGYFEAAD